MNTQNIETIEGAKPCLIDEQQANELIEANTQEMEDMEDLLTSTQIAVLAGLNHHQVVHDWLKKGHIVGWKNARHDYVFPAGQFDKHGQPIKRLDRITQLFDAAYEMWYWLTTPNDALDGAEPLALLHKGEVARVKAAAKGYLQGDVG